MRHKFLFPLFLFLIVTLTIHGKQKDFVLNAMQTVTVACNDSEEPVVHTALELFAYFGDTHPAISVISTQFVFL